MNLVVPQSGSLSVCQYLAYIWSQTGAYLTIKLYKSDTTPDWDTVLADLTECDFSGYASMQLTAWDYAGVFLDGDGRAKVNHTTNYTAMHNGGGVSNNVYGFFVVDNTGDLCWLQRFDSPPIAIDSNGKFITVVPSFTLMSEFSPPP